MLDELKDMLARIEAAGGTGAAIHVTAGELRTLIAAVEAADADGAYDLALASRTALVNPNPRQDNEAVERVEDACERLEAAREAYRAAKAANGEG